MDPVPAPSSRMFELPEFTRDAMRFERRGELGATAPTARGLRSKERANTNVPED